MLTTIEGTYKDGLIELSEMPEGMEHTEVLVTFLPHLKSLKKPEVLYGIWKDKFAADFDTESALKEIRGDWAREWETDES